MAKDVCEGEGGGNREGSGKWWSGLRCVLVSLSKAYGRPGGLVPRTANDVVDAHKRALNPLLSAWRILTGANMRTRAPAMEHK